MHPLHGIVNPTVHGLAFYIENIIIVSGYLYVALIMAFSKGAFTKSLYRWEPPLAAGIKPRSLKGFWRWCKMYRIRISGLVFFLLCGLTHIELAIHGAFGIHIINDDGSIAWHMHLIHIPQGLSVWIFVTSLVRKPKLPPLDD